MNPDSVALTVSVAPRRGAPEAKAREEQYIIARLSNQHCFKDKTNLEWQAYQQQSRHEYVHLTT